MTTTRLGHRGLVVEDDEEMASELGHLLESMGFAHAWVETRADAEARLKKDAFCFILLDLQIKSQSNSIKGHVETGLTFLRNLRVHETPAVAQLPVIVVTGHAKDCEEIVEAMRSGADDVAQKPLGTNKQALHEKIRAALQRAGRHDHALCVAASKTWTVSITDQRKRKRHEVRVDDHVIWLSNAPLQTLLALINARLSGDGWVHKSELGAKDDHGFQQISRLRAKLDPTISTGAESVVNDGSGNYRLADFVVIGPVATDALSRIGEKRISELAELIRKARSQKRQSE